MLPSPTAVTVEVRIVPLHTKYPTVAWVTLLTEMLPGPTAVTVEVRIAFLHTMYPAVAWVALLTEAKANESPIWAAGQRAGF
nr:hypothetical protein [Tanacetum cinerariifolium]